MRKNKKLLISVVIGIIVLFQIVKLSNYFINKYYNHQFESSLKSAAKIPVETWEEKYKDILTKDKYNVVLVAGDGSEYSYAEYFKYAAERIGWQVKIYRESIHESVDEVVSFNPDFILFSPLTDSKLDMKIKAHRARKYYLSFTLFQVYRNLWQLIDTKNIYRPEGSLKEFLKVADGVLTVTPQVDIYNQIFKNMQKQFNGFRMFPLLPKNDYQPAEPNNLMWIGMGTDKYRTSSRYFDFIKKLSNDNIIKVYGPYLLYTALSPNAYDGYIAPGPDNLAAIRKNGIYLLTHSDLHFQGNAPSMKVFEAASANAVIISDRHPFVIENFGDNVLYFDREADSEVMYKQVKAHYDWIKANPEKAKAMADRVHQVFLEKFTLERDLERIAKMHEYVMGQEKKMGISYPLAY